MSIDAATGVVTWTTPLGAAYTARPRDLPTAEPPVDPLEEEWWEECAADLLFDLDGCDPARWLAEDDLLPDG